MSLLINMHKTLLCAQKRQRIYYHTGNLAKDRMKKKGEKEENETSAIANLMYGLHLLGFVCLVQRRTEQRGVFEYIAVVRKPVTVEILAETDNAVELWNLEHDLSKIPAKGRQQLRGWAKKSKERALENA